MFLGLQIRFYHACVAVLREHGVMQDNVEALIMKLKPGSNV